MCPPVRGSICFMGPHVSMIFYWEIVDHQGRRRFDLSSRKKTELKKELREAFGSDWLAAMDRWCWLRQVFREGFIDIR